MALAVGVARDLTSMYWQAAVYRGLNVLRSREALELDGPRPNSRESINECRVSKSEAFTVHIALARRTKKGAKVGDIKVLYATRQSNMDTSEW